jgi:hypothetical protein
MPQAVSTSVPSSRELRLASPSEPGGENDGAQHDHGDRVHEKREHAAAHGDHAEPDQDVDGERAGFAGGEPQEPVMLFLGDLAVLQQAGEVEHDFHGGPVSSTCAAAGSRPNRAMSWII